MKCQGEGRWRVQSLYSVIGTEGYGNYAADAFELTHP